MRRRFALPLAILAATALAGGSRSFADDPKPGEKPAGMGDEKPDDKGEAKAPPATVAAEKGPFQVWVEAQGALEPVGAVEVKIDPDAYGGEWEVLEAAAPGPVKAGDVLVKFDPEKIDEQTAAAEKDMEIARRALAVKEEEAKRAEEGARLSMEKAQTEKARADEALEHFTKIERDLRVKEAEHRLQGTRDNISDQEEELAQLEKMYKADDLVEGTEEIVLKRAKRALLRSNTWLGFQLERNKHMLEVELPQDAENLAQAVQRESFELDRLKATQPISLEQGRLDLDKSRSAFERQSKSLAKLKADRAFLTVTAPSDGIAVPGGFQKGRWTSLEETTRALKKGETLKAKAPIFTIVKPGALSVRTTVPEASVLQVAVGQKAEVTPAVEAKRKVAATVAKVARVSADGNFEVGLDLADKDDRWMPGYAVKVRILTADKADAVTVPAASVVTDGEKKTVHVVADGKTTPREVETGATSGGKVEILSGLSGGEKILKSPPKPQ